MDKAEDNKGTRYKNASFTSLDDDPDRMTMAAATTLRQRLVYLTTTSFVFLGLVGFWLGYFRRPLPPMSMVGSTPTVTLPQGTYIGVANRGDDPRSIDEFLGIPYAKSTGGERRFGPPVALDASNDTFDAARIGDRCPGGAMISVTQSEDCLNLNLYRPTSRDRSKALPVLVYVHGGSFNGYADRQISNLIAWSAEPFIGIIFNYRIGALGFLPSGLTQKEGLLNAGLKDQALLFQWVQDNVAAFGGNASDVTLMGSSAGAHSIGHHLMRDVDTPPPFHKAILESGATTSRAVYAPTHPLHEAQFRRFLKELDCSAVPEDKIISTLRSLDTDDIKRASDTVYNHYNPSVRWPFQPVIDGEGGMIPVAPIDAWHSGKWHKIPILTGFNTNEGARFVPQVLSTSKEFTSFFHKLLPGLSESDLKALNEAYLDPLIYKDSKYAERRTRNGLGSQFKRLEQAYAHFAYVAPVRQTARFASGSHAPVYLYHFAVNSSVIGGADHGDHNPFVTYNPSIRHRSSTLDEISGTMHAYWTSFITKGDPNAVRGRYPKRPEWPAYVPDGGKLVLFGEGNDEHAGGKNKGVVVQVTSSTWALEECQYWWARTKKFEY